VRLRSLRVGTEASHPSHQFRNLKDITIDFDEDEWVTVLIGWNGTGKSNVLEALTIIFRDLIAGVRVPAFAYTITYEMGTASSSTPQLLISIDADPLRSDPLRISVRSRSGERTVSPSRFFHEGETYLPRYLFSYYSGESSRMQELFKGYLARYDSSLRSGDDPGPKRLFYAMPVHSQFVLLTFLAFEDEVSREILKEHLGLDATDGLESVLFVLREPPWRSSALGDARFWNARGVVRDFLAHLYEVATAPIAVSRRERVSLWNSKTLEFKYLFVKSLADLRVLADGMTPATFFRNLESTYVSELLEEIRVRVRLGKGDNTLTFKELSEGEQQLITVLGLLRFTAEAESLFLLDEPDTHLNPRWAMDYMSYLEKFVALDGAVKSNSHVVLTTHNPMAIAELTRDQVQVLKTTNDADGRRVVAFHPELDPRGMGYAAIVTSDMFGIASSLDRSTQLLLEQQRALAAKTKLSRSDQAALDKVNDELDRLGFRFFLPDDEYSRYLRLRNDLLVQRFDTAEPDEIASKVVEMSRVERELLATELIRELVEEDKVEADT
jgi:predicted ATPase